jgi:YgiT-type zinc finger domain-containing protein
MKCVICHNTNIAPKEVEEEFPLGNDIVKVKITTLVCATCGERYYDRKTMRELENIRDSIASNDFDATEVGKVLAYQM